MSKTLYEVEWTSSVPLDEDGDALLDQATNVVKRFEGYDDALSYAKKVLPKDWWHSVMLTPCHYERHNEDGHSWCELVYDETEFISE